MTRRAMDFRTVPALLVAGLVAGFAAGCGDGGYQQYVNGFLGKTSDALYVTWGAPNRSAPLPNGGTAVTFVTNVQNTVRWGLQYCETTYILDAQGIAREASFKGDSCFH